MRMQLLRRCAWAGAGAALVLAGLAGAATTAAPAVAALPAAQLATVAAPALLAADGALAAAVIPGDGRKRCTRIVLWGPGRAPVAVPLAVGCGQGGPLEGVAELALGGRRVLWQETNGGNDLELIVKTATLARPAPVQVAYAVNGAGAGGDPVGAYTGHLRADGPLLAYGSWRVPAGDGVTAGAGDPTDGALQVVVDGRARALLAGSDVINPLWVDGGRILVRRPDATLALLRGSTGTTIRAFTAAASGVGGALVGAAFQGARLVVLRTAALDVIDTETAALVRSFPLKRDPARRLVDLQSGIAVLADGKAAHLVRLADGRGTTFKGARLAQLEPQGLFLASGRGLSFVPLAAVLRRLPAA